MGLFFAALVLQWFDGGYPGGWSLQVIGGALLLPLMLLVAWSISAIRDRSASWWFQSDPSQVGLMKDEGDDNAPLSDEDIPTNTENVELRSLESSHLDTASHHAVRDQARTLWATLSRPSSSICVQREVGSSV